MKIERIYGTEVSPPTHLGSQTPRLVHSAIEFNRDKQRQSSHHEERPEPDPDAKPQTEEVIDDSVTAKPIQRITGILNIIA